MRLLGSSIAVPLVFSVHVAGEHGYLCSDVGGNTNTTYDQALVEKSVTDACLPDSELTAAQLAANVEAKKYPQVWVDSEDYGFNETVLFWKYQGNSTETQEGREVLVFTNRACNILGLVRRSEDHYTICEGTNGHRDKTDIIHALHKNVRRFFSDDEDDGNEVYDYAGSTSDNPIVMSPIHEERYIREQRGRSVWDYSRRVGSESYSAPPVTWQQTNDDASSIASTEYGTASQDFSSTYEDDSSQYSAGNENTYMSQNTGSSSQGSRSKNKGIISTFFGRSRKSKHLPATRDFPSTRSPPRPDLSRERHSGRITITPGPPTRPVPTGGYTKKPYRPTFPYGPPGTEYVPDNTSNDPPYISGEDHSYNYEQENDDTMRNFHSYIFDG